MALKKNSRGTPNEQLACCVVAATTARDIVPFVHIPWSCCCCFLRGAVCGSSSVKAVCVSTYFTIYGQGMVALLIESAAPARAARSGHTLWELFLLASSATELECARVCLLASYATELEGARVCSFGGCCLLFLMISIYLCGFPLEITCLIFLAASETSPAPAVGSTFHLKAPCALLCI